MSPPRPTLEPQSVVAGDTLQFDRDIDNFPASDGWTLSYTLLSVGLSPININGGVVTSTDGTFNVNVPASTTTGWTPGKYLWTAYVVGSGQYAGQRFKVAEGAIEIKPNPATADATVDPRSQAKKNLDAIDAVLAGRVTADVQSYKIGIRELVKMRASELLSLRGYYAAEYKKERIAAGEQFPSSTVGAFFGTVG